MDAEAAALTQQIESLTSALAKKSQQCQTLKVWNKTPLEKVITALATESIESLSNITNSPMSQGLPVHIITHLVACSQDRLKGIGFFSVPTACCQIEIVGSKVSM